LDDRLLFDGFGLQAQGPTLTHGVRPGELITITGLPASGKTRLLRMIAGHEKPGQGHLVTNGTIHLASGTNFGRRTTPLSIVKPGRGALSDSAAQALVATNLWELRNKPIPHLTDTYRNLAELLPTIAGEDQICLLDGQLDVLDPYTLQQVWTMLEQRLRIGTTIVVVTSRPDIIAKSNWLFVLKEHQMQFAGSPEDLLQRNTPSEIEVITRRQEGVRALVEPFHVTITETENGLLMQASEGQALAAKLLLEGYGDVQMVLLKQPTLEEAIQSLLH
jgi:ABC-type multidrug transport system ATPase subunit